MYLRRTFRRFLGDKKSKAQDITRELHIGLCTAMTFWSISCLMMTARHDHHYYRPYYNHTSAIIVWFPVCLYMQVWFQHYLSMQKQRPDLFSFQPQFDHVELYAIKKDGGCIIRIYIYLVHKTHKWTDVLLPQENFIPLQPSHFCPPCDQTEVGRRICFKL